MFSLSNDKMNKMTEDNPLLAMMQSAFANDNESVKKTTDAWLSAMPGGQTASGNNFASNPMAAMAASSAVGFGMYTQMVGTMLGAMTGAMEAAEKMKDATENSEAPFGMLFNPLTFEWSDVNSAEPAPSKPKRTQKTATAKPVKAETKAPASKAEPAARATKPVEAVVEETAQVSDSANATPSAAKSTKPAPAAPVVALADSTPSAVEIMPEDFKRPAKLEKPETPDDLKLISGVGPKLEQVLNSMGIWTFAQIANWSAEEIAFVDDYLQFKGRINRDEWLKQAAELEKV